MINRRLIVFMAACMLILAYQWMAWTDKVRVIPPDIYAKRAVDLEVTEEMRYGFLLSIHGAFLAKTENTPLFASVQKDEDPESGARDEDEDEQGTGEESGAGAEEEFNLAELMKRELDLVPVKILLETLLYLAAFAVALWGPLLLTRPGFLPKRTPRWRCFLAGTVAGATSFWVMAVTLVLLDYGPPLYSTWVGPGAHVYSTGTQLISFGPGMTVSYRNVIEMLMFWPGVFYFAFAEMIPDRVQDFLVFGIMAPSFYGVPWGWICARTNRHRDKRLTP